MRADTSKFVKIIEMALQAIWRDVRSGQVKMLLLSTALGVAALSSVGFLSNRLESGLDRDARQMLGGDAVVTSSFKTPEDIVEKAKGYGLSTSMTLSFPTMARAEVDKAGVGQDQPSSESRLVSLKAVDASYPLRGSMKVWDKTQTIGNKVANIPPNLNSSSLSIKTIPVAGEVWVEAGLLEALQLEVGQSILLGQASFKVTQVLTFEPDKGAGFMSLAPRVLINQQDLDKTQLIQPSSRINWRFAVAGNSKDVKLFSDQILDRIESKANRGVRLETLESGRPEIKQTMERAAKFLRLVALLAVVLSSVAVALASRNFSQQHMQDCAMRRVLGQSQSSIATLFTLEFILLGFYASLLGLVFGYSTHLFFVQILSSLVDTVLPPANWVPCAQGLGVGMCCMLAFGLPPVLQLSSIPPLLVMRRELGTLKKMPFLVWSLGSIGLCLLMASVSKDYLLTLYVVGGFIAAIVFFAIMSMGAIEVLRKFVDEQNSPVWLRIATRQLHARRAYAVLQVSALSVGLLALLLLVLLRTDLIKSWRNATPEDAPNRFVINIQSDQSADFQTQLAKSGINKYDWYPLIKGRLIAINDESVKANRYSDERAQHLVDREFNLSHSAQAPANNQIVQGKWVPNEQHSLSIEEGIAKTLNLHIGDQLRFDISGFVYEAKITSIRKVDWSSMRTNFFVIFPMQEMADLPESYIAAFKAPALKGFDNNLVHLFPNITSIDIGSTLNQIQNILEQVTNAVEFLFVFTLVAGLIVLVACVHSTRQERAKEYAVIRAVGGTNNLLVKIQRAELWGMGALAGLMSSVCASAIGWGLAKYVFEFQWTASPVFIIMGTIFGVLVAWGAGWFGMRTVLNQSVIQTLRSI
jgi:putative ABC transport system permease protein